MGGVEQYILNVIDNINKELYRIDVLLTADRRFDREDSLIERNVAIHKLKKKSAYEKCKEYMTLIKKEEYDIIHCHQGHEAALWCVLSHLGGCKKVVIHAHTAQTGDENITASHMIKKQAIFLLAHSIFRKTSTCVACSDEAADFLFGKKGKYKVLFDGIDLDKYKKGIQGLDRRIQNRNEIAIIARLDPPKNPLFVVEIMRELSEMQSDVHLTWCGDGPMREDVIDLIHSYSLEKTISLIGTTNDVPTFLSDKSIFLLPSIYEGLGMVLIEAQQAGLVCFISDGIPSLVDCGGCIRISLQKNAREWADIIYKYIKEFTVPKIMQDKLDRFNINCTVKELEQIYSSI